jgi:hypothetical protein
VAEDLTKPKLIAALAWIAAAAFVVSWFLPVIDDVPGWMAFRYALAPLVPYRNVGTSAWDDSAPQVMSALTNVVFVILFVLWAVKQSPRPGLFVRITLACFLLNLYWPVSAWRENELGSLLPGYYLWLSAFALLATVAGLIGASSRRTSKTPTAGTPT